MTDKRQLLIDTALELFYENGVNSVGINEILKVSGVAKKTLYNHFKSKEELILVTLETRDKAFLQWLDNELCESNNDLEVIRNLFNGLNHWFRTGVPELLLFRGCFFINTSAEFSKENNDIKRCCGEHKLKVRALIQKYLTSSDPALLDMICLLKEGAIVSAHLNQDYEAAQKCIPLITRYLETTG
jgi:AcrR family transcriptional regulator